MTLGLIERPATTLPATRSRPPFTERGALRLFVRRDSVFRNLRDCVVAIASAGPPRSPKQAGYFKWGEPARRRKYAGRSASVSVILHCAVVAAMVYVPSLVPAEVPPERSSMQVVERLYYRVPAPDVVRTSKSSATGHRRLAASKPASVPDPPVSGAPKESLAAIVSKPSHPDNLHQTIYQSASPPDLTIKAEQKLPNVVILGQNLQPLKPSFVSSYAKPAPIERKPFAEPTPPTTNANSPNSTGLILPITDSNPRLMIPVVGGGGSPLARTATTAEGPPSNAPDLVVIGDHPADASNLLSVPNGNRWGEFSIAPPAQPAGSGNGVPGGTNGKSGKDNAGAAGKDSRGISGASGAAGPADIAGAGDSASGMLASNLALSLVYPVAQPMNAIRRNTMVVSAGSIGGGGLNVYGALNCGRIYSIFLPMPGKTWPLQYCDRSSAENDAAASARAGELRLEKPLVPPDVELNHRYDFKRIAVSAPNVNKSIILKGVIEADGTVQKLIVYQGVSTELDEAARLAFGRWRFKPAMRDGRPVAVDILVGIPPASGEDRVNR
jgi:Gram-negative bacterial TonB protein C-terminal